MFTGIIETVGTVQRLTKGKESMELEITAPKILTDVALGDSIAVNGVCLTVTSYTATNFTVDVMPETVDATSIHQLKIGDKVNLERAMSANGRFGGHFVAGHVDGVGKILRTSTRANAVVIDIAIAPELAKLCIPRGSITIDGISLTIFKLTSNQVTISVIPHTFKDTILHTKKIGDSVNIETDLLGKYIIQQLQGNLALSSSSGNITKDFLMKNGY